MIEGLAMMDAAILWYVLSSYSFTKSKEKIELHIVKIAECQFVSLNYLCFHPMI